MMNQPWSLVLVGLTVPAVCLGGATSSKEGKPGQSNTASRPSGNPLRGTVRALGFSPDKRALPEPPLPDFKTRIDYLAWYWDNLCPPPEQNAWAAYEPFVKDHGDTPAWQFKHLFDGSPLSDPAPWNPAEHPDWEQSYQASRELMAAYRKAARDPRPYCSLGTASRPAPGTPGRLYVIDSGIGPLRDFRALSKAAMAQAWRMENGTVNPRHLCEAFETLLGNARQLNQDFTWISHLVGMALTAQACDSARWALHEGVFRTEAELEQVLAILRRSEGLDLRRAIPGEQASELDFLQVLFPPEPGGNPVLDREARAKLVKAFEAYKAVLPDPPIPPEDATVADARDAAERTRAWYTELDESLQRGIPEVKPEDLKQLAADHAGDNELAARALWGFDRLYPLAQRCEATRRATVLVYELALYKARTGNYPDSLSQLRIPAWNDYRIDPFSGELFRYRLVNGEPLVYSVLQNGVDDGGVHSPTWTSAVPGASDDFVFWPPQPRAKAGGVAAEDNPLRGPA